MRFYINARRVRFVARSLKCTRYVFAQAPRGCQRALKAKISDRRGGELLGFARRQDAEIPGVFQGRQHSKTEQFTPLRRIVL